MQPLLSGIKFNPKVTGCLILFILPLLLLNAPLGLAQNELISIIKSMSSSLLGINITQKVINYLMLLILPLFLFYELYIIFNKTKNRFRLSEIIGNIILFLLVLSAIKCTLFIILGNPPNFSSLPEDPSWSEVICYFSLIVIPFCALCVLARVAFKVQNPAHPFTTIIRVSLVLLLFNITSINSRNFGRWADLKQELISYTNEINNYSAKHETINTKEKANVFYSEHPNRKFLINGVEVYIVNLWWLKPSRAGIVWGGYHTAAFDLDTMICVYSD